MSGRVLGSEAPSMENSSREPSEPNTSLLSESDPRVVYVVPREMLEAIGGDDPLTLMQVWSIVWRGKWLIVAITALFAVTGVIVALTATPWYRADVVLVRANQQPSAISGALGGLASLAGVNVGGAGNNTAESIAVLRSRAFIRDFIQDLNLLPLLYDESSKNGSQDDPDIRDAVRYFGQNILSVDEDRDTGLITLSIQWTDRERAAEWANLLVERLNDRMRQRALSEAQANVDYLQEELGKTGLVTLQQSIGRLLENELQKVMMARGNKEFALRVVDPAQVPKQRSWPRRTFLVIVTTAVGGLVALLIVMASHRARSSSARIGTTPRATS